MRALAAALMLIGGIVLLSHVAAPQRPALPDAPHVAQICRLGTSC